jgi:UDP-glucose 4-epimerase
MTVLVTGGAGYIGSHMVHELADRGERVAVLDDLSTGKEFLVPRNVPFIKGSVGDAETVRRALRTHKVRTVVHFAGSIVVPESVTKPLQYYENNTSFSRTLIEVAVESDVQHFLFSSTAAIYGEPTRVPILETDPMAPASPYGASKWMTEIILRDAARAHGFNFAALRYFNVAGADPRGRTGQSGAVATHLIKIAAQVVLGLRSGLDIYGTDYPTPDGTCIRDYVHVTDLARAHVLALDYLRDGGESVALNCGYGHGYSVREVVDVVKKVSGMDFPVRESARRGGDPAQLVASNERIRSALGWKPVYDDLETIVVHALAWEKKLEKQACMSAVM